MFFKWKLFLTTTLMWVDGCLVLGGTKNKPKCDSNATATTPSSLEPVCESVRKPNHYLPFPIQLPVKGVLATQVFLVSSCPFQTLRFAWVSQRHGTYPHCMWRVLLERCSSIHRWRFAPCGIVQFLAPIAYGYPIPGWEPNGMFLHLQAPN